MADQAQRRPAGAPKKFNLALQGGGAHGAFAWGIIDRLMEHGGLEIEGIVGTSAGAMNAAVTAYGLAAGGPDGACWGATGGAAGACCAFRGRAGRSATTSEATSTATRM